MFLPKDNPQIITNPLRTIWSRYFRPRVADEWGLLLNGCQKNYPKILLIHGRRIENFKLLLSNGVLLIMSAPPPLGSIQSLGNVYEIFPDNISQNARFSSSLYVECFASIKKFPGQCWCFLFVISPQIFVSNAPHTQCCDVALPCFAGGWVCSHLGGSRRQWYGRRRSVVSARLRYKPILYLRTELPRCSIVLPLFPDKDSRLFPFFLSPHTLIGRPLVVCLFFLHHFFLTPPCLWVLNEPQNAQNARELGCQAPLTRLQIYWRIIC